MCHYFWTMCLRYYLTSFEAAVEYVRSEHVQLRGNVSSLGLTQARVERMRSNSSLSLIHI